MSSIHPSCDAKMSFGECELTILRTAVDAADTRRNRKIVNSPEVQRMIRIVEEFLRKKKINLLWRNCN